MKQILQDLANGDTSVIEAPAPQVSKGHLLIDTKVTLISSGTERMLVDFGKASYFQKAKQQPEKVKMVLEKVKTDGLLTTIDAVRSKLSQPLPLGYCNVGVIREMGAGNSPLSIGMRVVSNGAHADVVKVPKNLCVRIPDNVDDESAAFTVIASIGLQGIRLAEPSLGEALVVIGAGLIGLLTIQLLIAQGCRVLAIDFDDHKLKLARDFGAQTCNLSLDEDPVSAGIAFSRGYGVDAVLITAATKSNDPVTQAAHMCRKRGRIVLVGVSGLTLNRADFYEKELTFQVSCSYGPGRYEENYEQKGLDYPIGFVRWTEQRNFEACLDMMASGKLNVKPLITHRYLFEEAASAYITLTNDKSALGIILSYPSEPNSRHEKRVILAEAHSINSKSPIIGFIGAGNYASRMLIPAFRRTNAKLHTIVTSGGISGVVHGKRAGFLAASTDRNDIFENEAINTVAIVTQHNTHADLVVQALNAGKHVFVEKPLAIRLDELATVEAAYHTAYAAGKKLQLMVGFNRRFAPMVQKMKALLNAVKAPKIFIMTMNAGAIPADHWTQKMEIGGGRIIGEACHFIDLMRFLAESPINSITAHAMGRSNEIEITEDKATITLTFENGSMGTIHYLANGSSAFPKERIEVFAAGRVLQLDNFRKLIGYGWPEFRRIKSWRQDKGQTTCVSVFLNAIQNGHAPCIPIDEIFEVARVAIEATKQLHAKCNGIVKN